MKREPASSPCNALSRSSVWYYSLSSSSFHSSLQRLITQPPHLQSPAPQQKVLRRFGVHDGDNTAVETSPGNNTAARTEARRGTNTSAKTKTTTEMGMASISIRAESDRIPKNHPVHPRSAQLLESTPVPSVLHVRFPAGRSGRASSSSAESDVSCRRSFGYVNGPLWNSRPFSPFSTDGSLGGRSVVYGSCIS